MSPIDEALLLLGVLVFLAHGILPRPCGRRAGSCAEIRSRPQTSTSSLAPTLAAVSARHPDAAKHVAKLDEIEDMPIWRLMTLAKKMGADADTVIQETEEKEHRLRRYSGDCPAFTA